MRITQITAKAKAVVARTLAEVTAKVGAAAKVLEKAEKAKEKVRRPGDRAGVVPVRMRLRNRRRMSVKRRSVAGRVAKKGIVSLNVLGLIRLWAWQV